MKITIERYISEPSPKREDIEYDVDLENSTLLNVLNYIKQHLDSSLSFSQGCASSVCGSCAMRVNNSEVLACSYKVKEGDYIQALNNMTHIRDLVVDFTKALSFNKLSHAYSSDNSENIAVTCKDEKANELQSDCILCGACYSACPVYEVKPEFKGPFALTRVWRYVSDVRENDVEDKINTIQESGIWDCTLCNECVPVCPQGIAPKQDIQLLRSKSGMLGHMDPSFSNSFGGGFGSFDGSPTF